MTATTGLRAFGIALVILAAGFLASGGQPARASAISGSGIDQGIFCFLDQFHTTDVFSTGCTPTVSTGSLTVIKIVHGTSTSPSSFNIHVASTSELDDSPQPGDASGTAFGNLPPGVYTVSEAPNGSGISLSDYTAVYSGDCDSSGHVTVSANLNATCTITNTYNALTPAAGVLEVKKVIIGGPTINPDQFSFIVTGSTDGPGSALPFDPSGTTDLGVATTQTYSVAEVASSTYTTTYANSQNTATDCVTLSVTASATTTCTITNTYISSGSGTSTATTSDLALTKVVDNATPNVGDTVTYTLTVSDTGADATGVVVSDLLPSGVSFVSTSSTDVVGLYASSTGLWTIGALSSSTPATLHIVATVGSLSGGTVVTNTAAITGGDTSGDSANDSAGASFTVTIPGGGGPSNNSTPGGGGGGGGGGIGTISGPLSPGYQVGSPSTTTNAGLPAQCSQYLTAFIRFGAQNDSPQVTRLQQFLNQFEGNSLTVNGIYDAPTLAALEAFQSKYAADILTPWGEHAPTGFVYLTTRREVNEIYCHFTQNFPLTAAQEQEIANYRTGILGAPQGAGTPTAPTTNTVGQGTGGSTSATQEQQTAAANAQAGAAAEAPAAGGFWNSLLNFFSHIF